MTESKIYTNKMEMMPADVVIPEGFRALSGEENPEVGDYILNGVDWTWEKIIHVKSSMRYWKVIGSVIIRKVS